MRSRAGNKPSLSRRLVVAAARGWVEGVHDVLPDQSGAFGIGLAPLSVHLQGRGVAEIHYLYQQGRSTQSVALWH